MHLGQLLAQSGYSKYFNYLLPPPHYSRDLDFHKELNEAAITHVTVNARDLNSHQLNVDTATL